MLTLLRMGVGYVYCARQNLVSYRINPPVCNENPYTDGHQLHQGLMEYFRFYNHDRNHQSLGYQTPAMWYESGIEGEEKVQFRGFT